MNAGPGGAIGAMLHNLAGGIRDTRPWVVDEVSKIGLQVGPMRFLLGRRSR